MTEMKKIKRAIYLREMVEQTKRRELKRSKINPLLGDFLKGVNDARHRDSYKYDEAMEQQKAFFGQRADTEKFKGVERLRTGKTYFSTERFMFQQQKADYQNADRRIKVFVGAICYALKLRCVPLYANIVTAQKEPYQNGKAVEIMHSRFHSELTPQEWKAIGLIGKKVALAHKIPIIWGGDQFGSQKRRGQYHIGLHPTLWLLTDWAIPQDRQEKEEPKKITAAKLRRDFPYIG